MIPDLDIWRATSLPNREAKTLRAAEELIPGSGVRPRNGLGGGSPSAGSLVEGWTTTRT